MSFVIGFGLAAVLTPAAKWLGLRWGMVDRPTGEPLKIHGSPTSVLGGVAVVAAALGATAVLGESVPAAVLGAVVACLLAGLLDDVRPMGPGIRLLLQAAAGGILVAGGFRLEPLGDLGAVGVIFLVLACTNGVNILDGQDGLAGGLAALASLGLAALGLAQGADTATLGLALGGALIGFLMWNLSSARVFLGNGGAYAVGVLLAVLAVTATADGEWSSLVAAATCLGVFAFELTFTVARRLLTGRPLLPGDRLHSYDLLAARLGDRRRSTMVFWGIGAILGLLPLLVEAVPIGVGVSVAAATWIALMVAAFFLYSRTDQRTEP
jgi:UDP-GlcNAc:undecaprenyl-phosphate GlcNAc-1-phosphate transferase